MLPSTTVISRDTPPSSGSEVDVGTWFVTGPTPRGPSDRATLSRNLGQWIAQHGARETGYTTLYDAVEAFFRDGGSRVYTGRVVGDAPEVATVVVSDANDDFSVSINAANPGAWGADVDVQVVADGSTRTFVVIDDGEEVERSPALSTIAEYVAWSQGSDYIRITDVGGIATLVAGTYSLIGGTDDKATAADDDWAEALALFTKDLGPGQVSAPGRTTETAYSQLLDHAEGHNRRAFIDLIDSGTRATLVSAATTVRALSNERYGALFAPWAVIKGVTAGTYRTVPYSAIAAAAVARLAASGKSANVPAAGDNGVSAVALDLSQDPWSDDDRELLNDAGVNVALIRNEQVRTMGWRTPVNPVTDDTWLLLSNTRLEMELAARFQAIGEKYEFTEIDGRGHKVAEFNGALVGACVPYYEQGSLYGATFEEAVHVDTGPQVNTPETAAARELRALVSLRMSPYGEAVVIEVVKVATTEALA